VGLHTGGGLRTALGAARGLLACAGREGSWDGLLGIMIIKLRLCYCHQMWWHVGKIVKSWKPCIGGLFEGARPFTEGISECSICWLGYAILRLSSSEVHCYNVLCGSSCLAFLSRGSSSLSHHFCGTMDHGATAIGASLGLA